MLAAAVIARHAERLRVGVDHYHGVNAIFVALPAVILDGLAGPVLTGHRTRSILKYAGCHVMTYSIRQATVADIAHIVAHREEMFRDMAIPARFEAMHAAFEQWLHDAIPAKTYLGWIAVASNGEVAGGSGLIVMPWPPGPMTMEPRCGFVFNVYTHPSHRRHGLARRMMEVIHEWCRAEGIERVVLNASTFGHSLYESLGYVVTDEPMMRLKL